MRVFLMLSSVLLAVVIPPSEQLDQPDPYSIDFVHKALSLHSQGAYVSFVEKNIPTHGDQTSIALLKTFADDELSNARIVRSFLPLIRQSFSQPESISIDIDKKPRVTLFLLKYLQRNISDTQTQRDIEETIKFVEEKTAPN
jgi:hypothetical protein